MPIRFKCPRCYHELNVKDDLAGKEGRCPACKIVVTIPGGDAPVNEAPAEPAPSARLPVRKDAISTSERGPTGKGTDASDFETEPDDFSVDLPDEENDRGRPARRDGGRRGGDTFRREREDDRRDREQERRERDQKQERRAGRERWQVARFGIQLSGISMALYVGVCGTYLLLLVFDLFMGLIGSRGDQVVQVIRSIIHYLGVGLFLGNHLAAGIGSGLLLRTPARHGTRSMAILCLCLGIAGLILLLGMFFNKGLSGPEGVLPMPSKGGLVYPVMFPLLLLFLLIETAKNTCLAFYVRGVARELKQRRLAGRAAIMTMVVPGGIVATFVVDTIFYALIANMNDVGFGQNVLIFALIFSAVVFGLLAWFYFQLLTDTNDELSELA